MPKTNGSQFQIHWIGGRPMFRKRPLHDKCEELLVILDSGMEWKDTELRNVTDMTDISV